MHCNKVSFQELLDCFDNDLGNNLENNADNLEHNTENSQRSIVYNCDRVCENRSYPHKIHLFILSYL